MAEYIDREAICYQLAKQATIDGQPRAIKRAARIVADFPAADVRPVVLCRDCLHYEMGVCLKIYDDGAANKDAWQERKPDDYCSYGEDRNVPTNCRTDMRPTSMSGANGEES